MTMLVTYVSHDRCMLSLILPYWLNIRMTMNCVILTKPTWSLSNLFSTWSSAATQTPFFFNAFWEIVYLESPNNNNSLIVYVMWRWFNESKIGSPKSCFESSNRKISSSLPQVHLRSSAHKQVLSICIIITDHDLFLIHRRSLPHT